MWISFVPGRDAEIKKLSKQAAPKIVQKIGIVTAMMMDLQFL